jgi:hypothetical protein
MSASSTFFASKAARVAAPQLQQQQQAHKPVQAQPPLECIKAANRGSTPVQSQTVAPPPAAPVSEAPRGVTPVNASRRTLVLKSYPELKKECEEATAVPISRVSVTPAHS